MKQLINVPRVAPRIGLALGSGSARGWAHIGAIRVLEQAGISPDIVCGTSMGALVGAAYAAGDLDRLETWAKSLTWQAVVGLLDLKIGGGLIAGSKLLSFFRSHFEDPGIAQLPKAYAAVATELATGREVWLRDGSVIDEQDRMRPHMRFFVNGEQVFSIKQPLRPTDSVVLVQALSGG